MSANVYVTEPMTAGKVVLHTSVGPLDVELWSNQIPKACRNFIQLCMEGYYNNTIFHRIVKDYMVQGGDPTGTGSGGESIYGQPFKDEYHTRIRFSHRGLVACASFGRDQNGSQFFITLTATPELDKKNTIFGKVTGDSLFNLLRMGNFEVGPDERPLKPPFIKSVEVLWNPFDDIVPRVKELPVEEAPSEPEKAKVAPKKNLSLLSFADDADGDEDNANFKPKLSIANQEGKPEKKKLKRARESEALTDDESDFPEVSIKEEKKDSEEPEPKKTEVEVDPEILKVREESKKLIKQLKSKRNKKKEEEEKAAKEAKSMLLKQREKYVKRKKLTEDEISNVLKNIREKRFQDNTTQTWLNHQLKFEPDEFEIKTKDPSLDDGLVVIDPLLGIPINKSDRHLNKHQQKLRATKKLEKW